MISSVLSCWSYKDVVMCKVLLLNYYYKICQHIHNKGEPISFIPQGSILGCLSCEGGPVFVDEKRELRLKKTVVAVCLGVRRDS